MAKSKDLRDIAITHYKNGKKAPEIAVLLANKVYRATIHRWICQYDRTGSFRAGKPTGRKRNGRTKRLVNLVKKRISSDNKRKSLRTMSQDFGSSRSTIQRILKQDLKLKCYRRTCVQKLQSHHESSRKRCCTWIRKNFKCEDVHKIMSTDEKISTRNRSLNPKNDVIWASSRLDADMSSGIYTKEKFPVSVMIGMGVTWNGLTIPYFFETGERLNTETYITKLLPFYKEEGDRLFGHSNWCLQQDGASAHTSKESQDWCKRHLKYFIPEDRWPPNSPELNPLDYSIWDSMSKNINYQNVQTKNDLEREIRRAWKKIDLNYVRQVIGAFLRRVSSVEKHNGKIIIDEHS
ncbi:unnamed protein product [Rotaria sp. Silwood1]|nr:unnamed protein product [Rotaria sp. Silwood1]